MKGVIASIAPDVRVVDLCHEIPPQSTRRGGLALAMALPYFPRGTVHVAVVDPGVGSRRKILAFSLRGSIVLAPDNGLIGIVAKPSEIAAVHAVSRRDLWLEPPSRTFHGRDIFAPVAARLASGLSIGELGPSVARYRREELPRPRRSRRQGAVVLRGEVIDADRFGNLMTNLRLKDGDAVAEIRIAGRSVHGLATSYASVRKGALLAIVGSTGYVEIAARGGDAGADLGAAVGQRVEAILG